MRFSVILPLYHSHATLMRAIDSVLAQTLPVYEILLVVDDAGDYRHYCNEPRIKLLSTGAVASGAGNARTIGIAAATGDAVALLDADDAFHPTRLETLAPLIKTFGAAFTATRYIDDASGIELPNINAIFCSDRLQPLELMLSGMHTHVHVAFDRSCCPARYDISYPAEDTLFAIKLYDYVDVVGYSSTPLYDYYRSKNSFCNQQGSAQKFLDFIDHVLDPRTDAYAAIRQYRAFDTLQRYLQCMRAAEMEVIADPELSFQSAMQIRANNTLLPLLKENTYVRN